MRVLKCIHCTFFNFHMKSYSHFSRTPNPRNASGLYTYLSRIIRTQGASLDVTPPSAACDNANEDMWSAVWTLDTGPWSLSLPAEDHSTGQHQSYLSVMPTMALYWYKVQYFHLQHIFTTIAAWQPGQHHCVLICVLTSHLTTFLPKHAQTRARKTWKITTYPGWLRTCNFPPFYRDDPQWTHVDRFYCDLWVF